MSDAESNNDSPAESGNTIVKSQTSSRIYKDKLLEAGAFGKLDKLEQKFAKASENFWAEMRSVINLANKSDHVDRVTIDLIKKELGDILDSGILIYPSTLHQLGVYKGMSYAEKREGILGVSGTVRGVASYNEEKFLSDMARKAFLVRRGNWQWRIAQESQERFEEGWYPFFCTLTVDPKKADPEKIWREGKEFRKWIKALVTMVCKEMGHEPAHKPPYRPQSDYVRYAGVVEHGQSREHHHGHFLVWLREIPALWKQCPNKGIRNPAYRVLNECLPMQTMWKWSVASLSPCKYFRTIGDIWSSLGFVLPLKDGKPMKIAEARVAGAYITKYLSKEHREWQHRMKATRNLGLDRVKTVLRNLPSEIVEALTWRPQSSQANTLMMAIHSVPQGIIRSLAKRQLYLNKFRSRQLDLKDLLRTNYGYYIEMLRSVQDGVRPDRMSSVEFFDWVSKFLPDQIGYCDRKLERAHRVLQVVFPHYPKVPTPTKIGANDIGHT